MYILRINFSGKDRPAPPGRPRACVSDCSALSSAEAQAPRVLCAWGPGAVQGQTRGTCFRLGGSEALQTARIRVAALRKGSSSQAEEERTQHRAAASHVLTGAVTAAWFRSGPFLSFRWGEEGTKVLGRPCTRGVCARGHSVTPLHQFLWQNPANLAAERHTPESPWVRAQAQLRSAPRWVSTCLQGSAPCWRLWDKSLPRSSR